MKKRSHSSATFFKPIPTPTVPGLPNISAILEGLYIRLSALMTRVSHTLRQLHFSESSFTPIQTLELSVPHLSNTSTSLKCLFMKLSTSTLHVPPKKKQVQSSENLLRLIRTFSCTTLTEAFCAILGAPWGAYGTIIVPMKILQYVLDSTTISKLLSAVLHTDVAM